MTTSYATWSFGDDALGYTWSNSTDASKALQRPGSEPDSNRIAACAYSGGSFRVFVTVPYETLKQVSFYALDGDSAGRTMSVSVTDVVTGNVLDSVNVSSFSAGKWLRWTISGPVVFTFTNTGFPNAVVSGIFIDPAPSGSAFYPTYLSETFVQGVSGDRLLRSRGVDRANASLDRGALLDGLGSVQGALTPGGGGGSTLSALAERDAFGNALAGSGGSGASADNPFEFLGGLGYWQEPDLGLSYVRARWLDSSTGSWMSKDPVDDEPRYSYAHNSPTRGTDPTGTQVNIRQFIGEVADTLRFVPAAARELYVDPAMRAWDAVKQASKKFQTKVEQAFSGSVDVVRKIYHKLENFFQKNNAAYEAGRQQLPPLLHNLLPPSLFDPDGFTKYQVGMIWGAIKGLFGMIPIIGAIPDIVDFLTYFFDHVAKEGFFKAIGSYFVEQWNGLKALFTQKTDIDPFQRGEIIGSILVTIIVTVVGIILTAGLALPVLFEGGVQNFFKNAKAMARAGVTAAKAGAKAKVVGVVEAAKAVGQKKLPPGLQGHIDALQAHKSAGLNTDNFDVVTSKFLKRALYAGAGEVYGKKVPWIDDTKILFPQGNDPTCLSSSFVMLVQRKHDININEMERLYNSTVLLASGELYTLKDKINQSRLIGSKVNVEPVVTFERIETLLNSGKSVMVMLRLRDHENFSVLVDKHAVVIDRIDLDPITGAKMIYISDPHGFPHNGKYKISVHDFIKNSYYSPNPAFPVAFLVD